MNDRHGTAERTPPEAGRLKLLVENKMAGDGAEHLLEVGRFADLPAVARAAYAHMNGPFEPGHEPSESSLREIAERIEEVVGPDNSIFRGLAEDGEAHTFYLEGGA